MKEREISYERTIYKSYMKISSVQESNFDERIILMNRISGVITCEKCYINGNGEYWYDITGKHALDYFCKMSVIGKDFITTLLLSICELLEQMQWNLIEERCLKLEPEMVFVSSMGEEITFVLYPETETKNTFSELTSLMEFLLTKVDHSEKDTVSWIYEIYEFLLGEEYGIADLKKFIQRKRIEDLNVIKENKECVIDFHEEVEEELEETVYEECAVRLELNELARKIFEKIREWVGQKRKEKKKEEPLFIVYPEDEELEEKLTIHPTVCMTEGESRGVLVYEGLEGYSDYEIGKSLCVVGKSHEAKMRIEKDTISQMHAQIEYHNNMYYIEDMNSTNGTYVNEEMLNYKEKRALHPGDIIQFADVRYRFW